MPRAGKGFKEAIIASLSLFILPLVGLVLRDMVGLPEWLQPLPPTLTALSLIIAMGQAKKTARRHYMFWPTVALTVVATLMAFMQVSVGLHPGLVALAFVIIGLARRMKTLPLAVALAGSFTWILVGNMLALSIVGCIGLIFAMMKKMHLA